ncbi:outer membrane beta-barrel protein [Larkinella insperata]|uniref:Outer membrane beta-barrel protein n=1 Tax=Larkinella insperata TaxID=332158 RepID=A0ABW3QBH7_9BACT|nr:outer membrane beta-barrel protein [Larkinella insperata]
MRNLLLLAGLAAVSTLAQAQTEKGQGIWTGNLSVEYSSQKNDITPNTYRSHSIQSGLALNRGAFFKDNWLIGVGVSAGLNANRSSRAYLNQREKDKTTELSTGLNGYIRRYWGRDRWRVFLGGGLTLNYNTINHEGENVQSPDGNSFTASPIFQVGANYYLTDRIGLEASTNTGSYPFSLSGVGVGLVILTGVNSSSSAESYEAPQTAKGRWIVGGGFSFITTGGRDNQPGAQEERSNTFTISPSIGWFVQKNLLLGVSVPLGLSSSDDGSAFVYGINPYVKKYISDNRLRPYVSGDLLYAATRNKSSVNDTKTTNHQAGVAVGAGLAYLLGERFIVEATLGSVYFNKQFYPENSDYKSWNGGLSATLQPGFTINYVFD